MVISICYKAKSENYSSSLHELLKAEMSSAPIGFILIIVLFTHLFKIYVTKCLASLNANCTIGSVGLLWPPVVNIDEPATYKFDEP